MSQGLDQHPLALRFARLTPEQVLNAIETSGQRSTGRFLILNSYENRVYQFELDNGKWVVGKFYRPGRWSKETILAEHRFLAELVEDEIPVAAPLTLVNGETLGEVEGILYALFPRIGGRAPEEPSDDQLRQMGRLIARIHNVGARQDEPHRPRITPEIYGRKNLQFLLENDLIAPEARAVYEATVINLLKRIDPMFEGVPVHRIHGDCHLNNLLWSQVGPTFLDFDDMRIGPAAQDIWLMAPAYDAEGQRQRKLLVETYGEMRDFHPSWLRLVEPLRALRFVHYATWIAQRWADPIFPRTFTYFGTLMYWQREIQDLREQIARLDNDPLDYGWS
jgi:Ser/Thr protein kinase RdoA (MazF antagonist)